MVGDVVAAQNDLQGVPQAKALHNVGDGLSRLGAYDAQAYAPAVKALQQLRRAGKQGGFLHLAGAGHLQKVGPELGAVLFVAVSGEHLIGVLQQIAHRAPHRVTVGNGQAHAAEGVLEAAHDGVSGVA